MQNAGAQSGYQMPSLLGKPTLKNTKTRSSNAKSGSMVDTFRRSGLAGIYGAPRNLDQIGAYCSWKGKDGRNRLSFGAFFCLLAEKAQFPI